MTKLEQLLHLMSDRLGAGANVVKVYGRPIAAHGRIIVPVAKVAYGFGAGAGRWRGRNRFRSENSSGGGGGAVAIPIGVLEITAHKSRYIPLSYTRSLLLAGALGALIGICIAPRTGFSRSRNRWAAVGQQQKGVDRDAGLPRTPTTNNLQHIP